MEQTLDQKAKHLLERKSKISNDVWTLPYNGLKNKELPLMEGIEKNTLTEEDLKTFEGFIIKGESKQKEYDELKQSLEQKKAIYDKITNDTHFPKDVPELDRSVKAIKSKLAIFQFDENNQYISGNISKGTINIINVDHLNNLWENKYKNSTNTTNKKRTREEIPEVNASLQAWSGMIQMDEESKVKAQKIQDLMAENKDEHAEEINILFQSLKNKFNETMPKQQTNNNNNTIGKCVSCDKKKKQLFGVGNTKCAECYHDEDLCPYMIKLQRKGRKFKQMPDVEEKHVKKFEKLERQYEGYEIKFANSQGKKCNEELHQTLQLVEAILKDKGIESDKESNDEEESFSSVQELPSSYDEEEEEEEKQDEQILEVLEVSVFADEKDRLKLYEDYKKDFKTLEENIKQIREKGIKYKIVLFDSSKKQVSNKVTALFCSHNIFTKKEDAEKKAMSCTEDTDFTFQILEIN